MTLARTVIAELLCALQDVKAGYLGKTCSEHYNEADAILAALAEAGFELVDTKVTRPDWKGIACDMIGIHALERRRAYFHAAETLEPGYTVEAANEQ